MGRERRGGKGRRGGVRGMKRKGRKREEVKRRRSAWSESLHEGCLLEVHLHQPPHGVLGAVPGTRGRGEGLGEARSLLQVRGRSQEIIVVVVANVVIVIATVRVEEEVVVVASVIAEGQAVQPFDGHEVFLDGGEVVFVPQPVGELSLHPQRRAHGELLATPLLCALLVTHKFPPDFVAHAFCAQRKVLNGFAVAFLFLSLLCLRMVR